MGELRRLIAGLSDDTPVVGIWRGGTIRESDFAIVQMRYAGETTDAQTPRADVYHLGGPVTALMVEIDCRHQLRITKWEG